MKQDYTDITIVLDRSGSMESLRDETIQGFNSFLAEQKGVAAEATITLAQFDDVYDIVYEGLALSAAPELTRATFVPRNCTALLDAMGRAINETGQRLAALPEAARPESVIFVTLTDGLENASQQFTAPQINEMIRHQRDVYNWKFLFLGANQDAIMTAGRLGIGSAQSLTYASNEEGARRAFSSASARLAAHRRKEMSDLYFLPEDRAEQEEALKKPKK
jgi:hypothetical protein